ncbi:MAG: bifunctional riboflavin kinase/FAD synthetase [Planctomycetaceae bacterium]|nr:bifunctional riboflavin kinase/FAD synthetase [Planctomycetaceae bacterium]
MKHLRGLDYCDSIRGAVVSIGNFDGVHRGHRSMLALLVRRAGELGAPAVVFTFDPHPIVLLRPNEIPPPLSTTTRKLELLEPCGADCVLVYPTDLALLALTPREFFDRIVIGRLAARGLVEGPNFFFGHDRAGDIDTLAGYCSAANLSLDVVPPLTVDGQIVSSSTIRRLILDGQVGKARTLLGQPYQLRGKVVPGARRGRTIGFPTANLEQVRTVLPSDGVYAGQARVDGVWHAAGINVGPNPTFAEQARKLEVHLVDFQGDLYDRDLDVEFFERLRDTRPFASLEALKEQLQHDIDAARGIFSRESI